MGLPVISINICFLNTWNPVFLHSRRWLDFKQTFWTHHLSVPITRTVIDFFAAMHLRIVCDNFCKSLVMIEVLVIGENSWFRMEFFFTESNALSIITQTIVTCRNCAVLLWVAFEQMLTSWGCNYWQLFGDFLGSLAEFSSAILYRN